MKVKKSGSVFKMGKPGGGIRGGGPKGALVATPVKNSMAAKRAG